MKHLKLFNIFEQGTTMRKMPLPFEKGLLAIFNERKKQVSKINLGNFPLISELSNTTSIENEFAGNPPQEPIGFYEEQPIGSLRKKNQQEYKSNLFKCLVLLVGSFGDKENNPIEDYKFLLPYLKVLIPNLGEGLLQTMITQCSQKLSTMDKSQGMNLLRLFKKGYGIGG